MIGAMHVAQISWWNIVVLSFVVTAAFSDVMWRKIPRAMTVAGCLAGIAYHAFHGGILSAVAGTLIGFAIGLTFFHLGAIGGGDVKLITALGAMLGLPRWLTAMEAAIFVAAAVALLQAGVRGRLVQTFRNMAITMRWMAKEGLVQHPEINAANPSLLRAPFGVAAALGTIIAVFKP
jgi:prepilin peptidase CpaA